MLNDGENDSVVTDDTCVIHPTWNASVCRGDVGRLYLGERRPAFRVGALAAAAAPGAPAGQPAPAAPAAPAPLVNPAPPPPELPHALVRNGREFRITGSQSTVRAGT
jgi:cell migration-inducing and hyaluronan-binding protein